MKRLLIYIICVLAAVGVRARTYSVSEIPNVHLSDSTRFVTNPDGIMSPGAEMELNETLRSLRRTTSAEVAVVVVDDIDEDIDEFATQLFRAWGLGKKDTNNGLLLLIAKDQRRVVFRTGGGMEGLLPDGLLGSLIRKEIAPRFREGDYDGGITAAMGQINTILTRPEAREEILSKYANDADANDISGEGLFNFYLTCCGLLALAALALLCFALYRSRRKDRHAKYLAVNGIYPTVLFMSFVGLGMPLIALLPLLWIRHRLRRGARHCPQCGSRMQLMDEQRDNDFLNRAQDLEEQIGSIDYDVWVCPRDGYTEIIPYLQRSSAYRECPVCHARTYGVVSDQITQQPTTRREGTRRITMRCLNCGHEDNEYRRIPRKSEPVVAIIPGAIGGGEGGGSIGGSFGGGFTAGGGASGGW